MVAHVILLFPSYSCLLFEKKTLVYPLQILVSAKFLVIGLVIPENIKKYVYYLDILLLKKDLTLRWRRRRYIVCN